MNESTDGYIWKARAIMLLDLDAFFASVEQLDHPGWRGKPVIVGGDAHRRGVVSTCSYEARAFGVRSAMPAATAAKLCPNAIWTSGNFARYSEVSQEVMNIMRKASPLLQQVSIDEAFLDISPTRYNATNPVETAKTIQAEVAKLGITASVGLGVSKSVAKVASDVDKPQGLTVVYPGREIDFLSPLPLKAMSGIGPVAQKQLHGFGIHTLGEVGNATPEVLESVFGKNADMMRKRCLGRDTDPVITEEETKSISNEISFAQDLLKRSDIEAAIASVAAKVGRRLRLKQIRAQGIVLKVKYTDLKTKSATAQLPRPSNNDYDFIPRLNLLLDELWVEGIPLRLIGAAAIHLTSTEEALQMSLFDTVEDSPSHRRSDALIQATDAVRSRFGESALSFGREMRTHENLTGSSSKNPADYK